MEDIKKETTPEVPVQEQPKKIKNFKFKEVKNKTFSNLENDGLIW